MAREEQSLIGDLLSRAGTQQVVDAINKLEQAIKLITNALSTYLFIDNETPGGTINGTNKVFTLDETPDPARSLQLFLDGVFMTSGGEDYDLSGITVTFIEAPLSDSILRAFYRY